MSLTSFLDRAVQVVTVTAGGRDAYGDRIRTSTPGVEIRARRDQVSAGEDIDDRDQQARTFQYVLELVDVNGDSYTISGRDRIVDDGETLEVLGTPELVSRRRRPHHLELRAYRIEG